jgi:hypothetical protein
VGCIAYSFGVANPLILSVALILIIVFLRALGVSNEHSEWARGKKISLTELTEHTEFPEVSFVHQSFVHQKREKNLRFFMTYAASASSLVIVVNPRSISV